MIFKPGLCEESRIFQGSVDALPCKTIAGESKMARKKSVYSLVRGFPSSTPESRLIENGCGWNKRVCKCGRVFNVKILTDDGVLNVTECRSCRREYNKFLRRNASKEHILEKRVPRGKSRKEAVPIKKETLAARYKLAPSNAAEERAIVEEATPLIWFCQEPDTRGARGILVQTPKPMLKKEAVEYFHYALSRKSLSNCSVWSKHFKL